jgi:hypothetical protein
MVTQSYTEDSERTEFSKRSLGVLCKPTYKLEAIARPDRAEEEKEDVILNRFHFCSVVLVSNNDASVDEKR